MHALTHPQRFPTRSPAAAVWLGGGTRVAAISPAEETSEELAAGHASTTLASPMPGRAGTRNPLRAAAPFFQFGVTRPQLRASLSRHFTPISNNQ